MRNLNFYTLRALSFFFSIVFLYTTSIEANMPTLKTIDGQTISLPSLKGKWIFINYWASWCTPCLHEIPTFNQFYQQYKNKNIAVFGVNYDGLPVNEQRPLIKQYQLDYPSLAIDPAEILNLGEIKGIPVTFIFNPNGTLLDTKYGEQSLKSLSAYL